GSSAARCAMPCRSNLTARNGCQLPSGETSEYDTARSRGRRASPVLVGEANGDGDCDGGEGASDGGSGDADDGASDGEVETGADKGAAGGGVGLGKSGAETTTALVKSIG